MAGALLGGAAGLFRIGEASDRNQARSLEMQDRRDRLRLLREQIRNAEVNRDMAVAASSRADNESRLRLQDAAEERRRAQEGRDAAAAEAARQLAAYTGRVEARAAGTASPVDQTVIDWMRQGEESLNAATQYGGATPDALAAVTAATLGAKPKESAAPAPEQLGPEGDNVTSLAALEASLAPGAAGVDADAAALESAMAAGGSYTVRAGDGLAIIARRELGDASRWQEIALLNDIRNPRTIQPGQVLRMPPPRGAARPTPAATAAVPVAPAARANAPGATPMQSVAALGLPAAAPTGPAAALAAAQAALQEAPATPAATAATPTQPLAPRWQAPRMQIPPSMLETLEADAAVPAGLSQTETVLLAQRMQTQLAQLSQTVTAAATNGREPAVLAAINAVDALAYAYKGQGVYLPGIQQQLVRHRQLLEQAAEQAADPMTGFKDEMLSDDEAFRHGVPSGTWRSQVMGRRVPPRPSTATATAEETIRRGIEAGTFASEEEGWQWWIERGGGRRGTSGGVLTATQRMQSVGDDLANAVESGVLADADVEPQVRAMAEQGKIAAELVPGIMREYRDRRHTYQARNNPRGRSGRGGGGRTGGTPSGTAAAPGAAGGEEPVRLTESQRASARSGREQIVAEARALETRMRAALERRPNMTLDRARRNQDTAPLLKAIEELEQKRRAHNARYGSEYSISEADFPFSGEIVRSTRGQ